MKVIIIYLSLARTLIIIQYKNVTTQIFLKCGYFKKSSNSYFLVG